MILRSLTKHVKDQNWFAVWIDFVIVVVGVFIGIQVANWNETQAERAQTERMLSDLIIDLSVMREQVANQSSYYLENATLVDALLNSLDAADKTQSDEIAAVFNRILDLEVPPSPPETLDELLVAARLDLLGDTRVRDALRGLAGAADRTAIASASFIELRRLATTPLLPYLSANRTPNFDYRKGEVGSMIIAVDTEALRSDTKARVALARLYTVHTGMRAISLFIEDSIATVLAAAGDAGY